MKIIVTKFQPFLSKQVAYVIDTDYQKDYIDTFYFNLENLEEKFAKAIKKHTEVEAIDLYGFKQFSEKIRDRLQNNFTKYEKNGIIINIK
jgi:hypothetical protein